MARHISDKTKQLRKMGTGEGANYKPYITTSEFNSQGTTSVIRDWKTGRDVHCLSQGEMLWYYILRWDDDNVDIREQFPLKSEVTRRIAETNGITHPNGGEGIMTTDFLVTKADGSMQAYSVKPNRELSERSLQKLCIEKIYWNSLGVDFHILFKTDANKVFASNIRLVTEFYNASDVFDPISAMKHKIAIKEVALDLSTHTITVTDLKALLNQIRLQERINDK